MDYTVHRILQARILEWVTVPFSRLSYKPRDRTQAYLHCRWILYQLSHQGSPRILEWVANPFSRGFSWPRNWTGVSCIAAAAAKSLQSCPALCDPIDGSPPGSPVPEIFPGKNTGVGCHFLLQCMKVKSEREVTQSCLTLHDPMDRSLPGSSVHGIFQARVLEWGAITFSAGGFFTNWAIRKAPS